MARRGVLDDLKEIANQLPWRIGVILTAVSVVALHLIAMNPIVTARPIGVFAWFLQFIVPACLLLGAFASYLRRRAVSLDPWRHVTDQRLRYERLR